MKHPDWIIAYAAGKSPRKIALETGANRRSIESYLCRHRADVDKAADDYRRQLIKGMLTLHLRRAAEEMEQCKRPARRQWLV
ncbi:MAG TPA: hypothetical protein ENN29_10920 [Candidatus Hydrogenedentes bacterium]|nr:hypothetical protein [Candidatus Hydrogenedentota bacterium]